MAGEVRIVEAEELARMRKGSVSAGQYVAVLKEVSVQGSRQA